MTGFNSYACGVFHSLVKHFLWCDRLTAYPEISDRLFMKHREWGVGSGE
ncbi:MAG: hypothetical protein KME21_31335 [Desmonostoc vinosum HA7617-LM4]|nr:hypothetical protein [Desmonostoc vinosum HA7617-LM4]